MAKKDQTKNTPSKEGTSNPVPDGVRVHKREFKQRFDPFVIIQSDEGVLIRFFNAKELFKLGAEVSHKSIGDICTLAIERKMHHEHIAVIEGKEKITDDNLLFRFQETFFRVKEAEKGNSKEIVGVDNCILFQSYSDSNSRKHSISSPLLNLVKYLNINFGTIPFSTEVPTCTSCTTTSIDIVIPDNYDMCYYLSLPVILSSLTKPKIGFEEDILNGTEFSIEKNNPVFPFNFKFDGGDVVAGLIRLEYIEKTCLGGLGSLSV